MQKSATYRTCYHLFLLTPLLLIAALTWMLRDVGTVLPLHTALLNGFIGCGGYIVSSGRAEARLNHERVFQFVAYSWLLMSLLLHPLLIFTLDVMPLITIVQIASLLIIAFIVLTSLGNSAFGRVWLVGLVLVIAAMIVEWIPTISEWGDVLRFSLGYPLLLLSCAFWMMSRISDMAHGWVREGLLIMAGLVAAVGIVALFLPGWIGRIIGFLIYGMVAARAHRALSRHNPASTLASHWVALAVLLFWGAGFAFRDSPFSEPLTLKAYLMTFACAAAILGTINQGVAEMRRVNRRVTGLIPFWCFSLGVMGSAYALSVAGLLITLPEDALLAERIGTLGDYMDYGLLVVIVGLCVYTLALWLRRVPFIAQEAVGTDRRANA